MDFGKRVAFAAALAILAAAALGATSDRSAAETTREGAAAKTGRLVSFRGCPDLLQYAKSQATRFVGPYGLGGGPGVVNDVAAAGAREAAPPSPKQGVDFSGTNVQEEGVDEPDIVKTNGNTLFAVANGKLNAVDVRSAKPQLARHAQARSAARSDELLLHDDRLLLLSRGGYWAEPMPAMAARMMPFAPSQDPSLTEIDVSNPQALRVVRTLSSTAPTSPRGSSAGACGSSSRRRCRPLPFVAAEDGTKEALAAAAKRNRAVVASSRVGSWLPSYQIKRPGAKRAAEATRSSSAATCAGRSDSRASAC